MKILKLLLGLAFFVAISFTGCKPKDADIKADIEKELKSNPATENVMVMVDKGVVTLSGEVEDDGSKTAMYEKVKGMKGVETIQDNTVVPAPAAPVTITADDPLMMSVRDATKDFPGVNASVSDGVITVTGEITQDKWKQLKMRLDGLNPKRVDGSGLTIK